MSVLEPHVQREEPSKPHDTIERRSWWSGFFIFLGIIGLIITGVSGFSYLNAESSSSITLVIVGIITTIQSFFFAFLINVFTDIRWFLSQIAEKQNKKE